MLDDAGTDNTQAAVARFGRTIPSELRPLLRYERNEETLGIGGNFDRAVRLTQGDFVAKLDSDDTLEPNFVKVLGDQLTANPKAGWAHCNVINVRPDCAVIGLAHTCKLTGFYLAADALGTYLEHNDTCHCVMLRKAAYLAVGGYRPEMKTCEDWLLWLEMLLGGWGYCYDDRPLARMRKYEARPDLMTRRRQDFVASAKLMVARVEGICRERKDSLGGPRVESALRQFRASTARLCVSSGCDEREPVVRRALFEAAHELAPSSRNRLWLAIGPRLPAQVTRFGTQVARTPRRLARSVVQRLYHRVAEAVP